MLSAFPSTLNIYKANFLNIFNLFCLHPRVLAASFPSCRVATFLNTLLPPVVNKWNCMSGMGVDLWSICLSRSVLVVDITLASTQEPNLCLSGQFIVNPTQKATKLPILCGFPSTKTPQTFEPLVCRADHGVTLSPVKLNHPVRRKRLFHASLQEWLY